MVIHPSADVQSENIGSKTYIWQFTVILKGAIIGNNCNINAHCFIENDVIIGSNVTLKCGVFLWDGIRIEDDVFIGPSVSFVNDKYPRSKLYPNMLKGVTIRKGASLGANSTIMGNITIGKYAMVGAGSVVTKDIPDFTLWVGNPARQIGLVCDCGHRISDSLNCTHCDSKYKIDNEGIVNKL